MIAGSFESSLQEEGLSQEKRGEVEGASIWFRIHGLLDRFQQMFNRRHSGHRGPDPDYNAGLDDLENIRKVIREELREREPTVNWGNQGSPPEPRRHHRSIIWDVVIKLVLWGLTAAVGFAYGRLWDHEHRISVLEGREAPSVRSP